MTEAYYVNINVGAALDRLEQAFTEPGVIVPVPRMPSGMQENSRIII
jgi:hypothetical protein